MDNPNIDFILKIILPIGALAFLILAACLYYKNESCKAANQHVERMKLLELGLSLPDAELARHQAENSRTTTAGAVGIIVPLVMAGSAVGVTAMMLNQPSDFFMRVALLCTVWGVAGLVSLVSVILSLVALRGRKPPKMTKEATEGAGPLAPGAPQAPIIEESSDG
jgi:hypothetical protein